MLKICVELDSVTQLHTVNMVTNLRKKTPILTIEEKDHAKSVERPHSYYGRSS